MTALPAGPWGARGLASPRMSRSPVPRGAMAPLLRRLGFSPHGNSKMIEGKQHPDRDAQFRYINDLVAAFQADGQPVISVDTKN